MVSGNILLSFGALEPGMKFDDFDGFPGGPELRTQGYEETRMQITKIRKIAAAIWFH